MKEREEEMSIDAEEECRLKSIVFSGKDSFIQLEHKVKHRCEMECKARE